MNISSESLPGNPAKGFWGALTFNLSLITHLPFVNLESFNFGRSKAR